MIKDDKYSEKQSNKAEDELSKSMNKSFEKLEQSFSVTTPEFNWFEQKIVEQKKQIQKKWHHDLLLFSVIALVILSVMLTTMFQNPVLFLSLQGFTLLLLIGYTSREFGRKGEMRDHE